MLVSCNIFNGVADTKIFRHTQIFYKIILVEGVFDAIVVGQNAIPILGSTLREESKLFQAIVIHDSPVYLALDEDAEKKTNYIVRLFNRYDVDIKIVDTSNCEDVGSMSRQEFLSRKNNAEEPDVNEMFILNRLKNL